jgi:hypothetical protein
MEQTNSTQPQETQETQETQEPIDTKLKKKTYNKKFYDKNKSNIILINTKKYYNQKIENEKIMLEKLNKLSPSELRKLIDIFAQKHQAMLMYVLETNF